jgi:hypothetical protein
VTGLVRRAVVLLLAAVAGLVLVAAPAGATFAARAPLPATGIALDTVQPATGVTATLASCSNSRWMNVTVSWTASPNARLTGYTVEAHRGDGTVQTIATVSPSTTSVSTTADKQSSGTTTATFTVTAQEYGWTAVSQSSGALTC